MQAGDKPNGTTGGVDNSEAYVFAAADCGGLGRFAVGSSRDLCCRGRSRLQRRRGFPTGGPGGISQSAPPKGATRRVTAASAGRTAAADRASAGDPDSNAAAAPAYYRCENAPPLRHHARSRTVRPTAADSAKASGHHGASLDWRIPQLRAALPGNGRTAQSARHDDRQVHCQHRRQCFQRASCKFEWPRNARRRRDPLRHRLAL